MKKEGQEKFRKETDAPFLSSKEGISIKRIKELLNDKSVSDKEAEEIRDSFRILAEIIFEKWWREKLKNKVANKN